MNSSNETLEDTGREVKEVKREVVKKIIVDPETISKMKRLISLYADEIPEGAKEIDVISFFFNKSFDMFLKSGEITRKLEEITSM